MATKKAATFDYQALQEQIAAEEAQLREAFKKALAARVAPIEKEIAKQKTIRDTAEAQLSGLEKILAKLQGREPRAATGRRGGGSGGGKATVSVSVGDALAFIKENEGDEGVATRALTSHFNGKPEGGWGELLDGKATMKGKGAGGRWFAK